MRGGRIALVRVQVSDAAWDLRWEERGGKG